MHEAKHGREHGRLSVPLHGTRPLTEQELIHHSYDLSLFPLYLTRKMAARVRVDVSSGNKNGPDLMAVFEDSSSSQHRLYAHLKADEQGVVTDSDDLYRAIHAAFESHAGNAQYIGFTRYGTPPYAPLFALALLYRKYGRGLYEAGAMLPTPWPSLTASHAFKA